MSSGFQVQEDQKPYNIRHRCFFFSKNVVAFIQRTRYDRIYLSMFDQLLRSATSIGANVVEGRAGTSTKDWRKYLAIALKSANETKYWLCLIRDTMPVEKLQLDELIREADEIAKIIASILIRSQ